MSLKEVVKELLKAAESDVMNNFFWSEAGMDYKYQEEEPEGFDTALKEKGIKYNHVDNYGGEGQGEDYWSVYSFNNDDELVYVKFDGYYASYDGSTFQEWFFVEPTEVVVTQWFKQK